MYLFFNVRKFRTLCAETLKVNTACKSIKMLIHPVDRSVVSSSPELFQPKCWVEIFAWSPASHARSEV